MVLDASKPEGKSINNFMSGTYQNFRFCSMDNICDSLTPNCFLAVTDVASAYRTCHIRTCDRKYQGLKESIDGKDSYMEDNFLSFGARASP